MEHRRPTSKTQRKTKRRRKRTSACPTPLRSLSARSKGAQAQGGVCLNALTGFCTINTSPTQAEDGVRQSINIERSPILLRLPRARAYRSELSIQVDQEQTKQMTKARRGIVSLKEKRQKNSRAWRHLMTRESGAGPNGTESPGGEREIIKDQHFTTLPKMTEMSKCLEDWIPTERWRSSVDVVDLVRVPHHPS